MRLKESKATQLIVVAAFVFPGLLRVSTPLRAAEQQPSQTATMTIPDGVPVRLSLGEALSSETNKTSDEIRLKLVEDVKVGGLIVVPIGTPAVGHVLKAEHKKMLGRGGKLEFTIDYIKIDSDTKLMVRPSAGSTARQGKGKKGQVITYSVILAPLSPLFLTRQGKGVQVPKDAQFNAYVDGDQKIPISLIQSSVPSQTSSVPGQVQVTGMSAAGDFGSTPQINNAAPSLLNLKSEPSGAEIIIDGEFVGNTPSNVPVGAGHHNIVLSKSGFKVWQRILTVGPGGNINLEATLEKE